MRVVARRVTIAGTALLISFTMWFFDTNGSCLFSCNDLDRTRATTLLSNLNYGDVREEFILRGIRFPGGYPAHDDATKTRVERYVFGSDAEASQMENSAGPNHEALELNYLRADP